MPGTHVAQKMSVLWELCDSQKWPRVGFISDNIGIRANEMKSSVDRAGKKEISSKERTQASAFSKVLKYLTCLGNREMFLNKTLGNRRSSKGVLCFLNVKPEEDYRKFFLKAVHSWGRLVQRITPTVGHSGSCSQSQTGPSHCE